ncbi:MAG: hypothetical protein ABIZ81_18405 [Opitutaceae bacterium]
MKFLILRYGADELNLGGRGILPVGSEHGQDAPATQMADSTAMAWWRIQKS